MLDARDFSELFSMSLDAPVDAVALSGDGRLVAVASTSPEATVTVWEDQRNEIRLVSRDQGAAESYEGLGGLEGAQRDGTCPLTLLAEAVLAARPTAGFTLTTDAGSPAGAADR